MLALSLLLPTLLHNSVFSLAIFIPPIVFIPLALSSSMNFSFRPQKNNCNNNRFKNAQSMSRKGQVWSPVMTTSQCLDLTHSSGSSFLLMWMLQSRGDGSGNWIPATQMSLSSLTLAIVGIWEVNQYMGALSLSPAPFQINK